MSLLPLLILAAVMTLAYYGFKDMFLVLNRHFNDQNNCQAISTKKPASLANHSFNAGIIAAE